MPRNRALNIVTLIAACLGMVAEAPRALAQQPGAEATDGDVESLVQRGIELRRLGRDTEALSVFEAALERAPTSTRVKVHLAGAHQALGNWVEAERYLGEALGQADDPYVRRHRETLDRAYDFVERRLGSLDVVGSPEGAELRLSGRPIGRLPLAAPVRVPIGSYVLEVRKEGYYTVARPVAIGGGSLLRESVTLGPRENAPPAWVQEMSARPPGVEDRASDGPGWFTWTLAGTGLGAAAVSAIAFGIRERHASTWNSSDCLQPGLTRGQVCPEELDSGRSAERWGIGAAIASGVLLGGAAVSFLLERSDAKDTASLGLDGCGIGAAGARCFGSF